MHPNRDWLSKFVLGTLTDTEATSISDHLSQCAECELTLKEMDALSDTVLDNLRQVNCRLDFEHESPFRDMLAAIETIGDETVPTSHPGHVGSLGEADDSSPNFESIGVYRVADKLGRGGMGTVYQAFHTRLKRVVALKVLRSDRLIDRQAVLRFEREMETVGQLDHPNIVRATDAGEAEGIHFLVMELIKGIDLSQLVQQTGPIAAADACELVRQAAIGLQHAHEHGLVHRDIKPSNLMLTASDQPPEGAHVAVGDRNGAAPYAVVKILDLGLATFTQRGQGDPELSSTGQLVGTIAYMAPEQTEGCGLVDARADVYSLGATLYKLLTGENYKTADPDSSLDRLPTHVPPPLRNILAGMLTPNRDDRYATAQEVADALATQSTGAKLLALLDNDSASVPGDRVKPLGLGGRVQPGRWVATFVLPLLVLAIIGAAAALSVRLRVTDGVLIVDLDDPNAVVKIDGETVEVQRANDGKTLTISVAPGTHELRVATSDGLRFSTPGPKVVISSGESTRITATLHRLPPARSEHQNRGGPDGGPETVGRRTPADQRAAADRQQMLANLQRRIPIAEVDDPFDPRIAELRQQLVAFRHEHFATPEAVEAARLMSRLVWPADALRREDITPADLKSAGQGNPANAPPELVAVLGDSRLKHWTSISSLAYGPDGTLHSAGVNGVLRQWNADSGEPAAEATQFGSYPAQIALASDCRKVAIMTGGALQLIDRVSGKTLTVSGIQHAYNHGLAFSPDGQVVAKGNADGTISLFEFATGTLRDTFQGHDGVVRVVVFSPDGQALASTGRDGTVRWWPLDGGAPRVFRGHTGRGMGLVFTANGQRLVSASDDHTLRVWSIEDGTTRHVLRGHTGPIHAIAIDVGKDIVASTSPDGSLKLWDVERGEQLKSIPIVGWPGAIQFNADGTRLAHAVEGSVLIWDVQTGQRINKSKGHDFFTMYAAVDDSGRMIASAGRCGTIRLVDLATRNVVPLLQPKLPIGRIGYNSVVFVPKTNTLAAAERSGMVRLWDAKTGESPAALDPAAADQIFALAASPDGTTLAACGPELYIWNLQTAALLHTIAAHARSVTAAAFAPDGTTLVTGGEDHLVRQWDVVTGELKQTFRGHAGRVTSVAVSPAGDTLASVGWDQTVRLWDLPSGRLRYALTEHRTSGTPDGWGQIASVAFSPDGSLLASTAYDGRIRLWDPRSATESGVIKLCHRFGMISQVAFTPEGRHLVTANGNGTVYLLRLGPRNQ